jgi:hypothetical protein
LKRRPSDLPRTFGSGFETLDQLNVDRQEKRREDLTFMTYDFLKHSKDWYKFFLLNRISCGVRVSFFLSANHEELILKGILFEFSTKGKPYQEEILSKSRFGELQRTFLLRRKAFYDFSAEISGSQQIKVERVQQKPTLHFLLVILFFCYS